MMKGRIRDEEARERLILWIRRRMDEFGITPQVRRVSSGRPPRNLPCQLFR